MVKRGNGEIGEKKHCALLHVFYTGQNHMAPVTYSMGQLNLQHL